MQKIMQTSEMTAYIKSKDWIKAETMFVGSEEYNTRNGLIRMLYKLDYDPSIIAILQDDKGVHLWTKYDGFWTNVSGT